MATFRVLLFSVLRQRMGEGTLLVEMPSPTTGAALLDQLAADYPAFADYRGVVRIAVNHEYASEDRAVGVEDEVALITPVSGG